MSVGQVFLYRWSHVRCDREHYRRRASLTCYHLAPVYCRLGKSSEINPLHVDFLVSVSAPFWITDAEHGRHLLKARPYPSINCIRVT